MRFYKYILFYCFMSVSLFAQQGINTTLPNPNAELTLGSTDKGMLFNRVKLVSLNSPKPLSDTSLDVGVTVYNTNVTGDLTEGVYFWSSEKKWTKIYSKKTPTRLTNLVGYFRTKSSIEVPYQQSVQMKDLDFEYTALEDGVLFLEYLMVAYVTYQPGNATLQGATDALFETIITDSTKKEISREYCAISPYMVVPGDGNKAVTAVGIYYVNVKRGEKYTVNTFASNVYAGPNANKFKNMVGNLVGPNSNYQSSLKVTFLSELTN
ncbi:MULTISPECIES: hypothetical protein [Myroides]|uniref:Uncharacterized protein n=3 Tax=Myroides odoratimimus TaxID=76832 RepID=A0A0S7EDG3_9FLAO|nr:MULTISPECIES: hypothetical protein [Myroides]ALU28189.1 hypothetical protein AS202_19455 [Myroides odoratimimus]APA93500.1 hypothetical protein BK054_14950 [Myroides sp. ZB35]EHO09068.1 hypothetical protein HMPREF9714_02041 [Myroides odoratimimus CCUG 12901]EHO11429.1 hypothetical protein HMPREF9715_02080 [Myroides odoratimimus CIP 101113]MCA4806570.1 hypothetical protein [Myroides odoratimimus]